MSSAATTISTQPKLTSSPALTPKANENTVHNAHETKSNHPRVRSCFYGVVDFISMVLTGIWIVLGSLPIIIVAVLIVCLCFGLSLGLIAANGSIALLTGNGILRAAHLAHYTDNASAAAIGATGTLISALIVGFISSCLPLPRRYNDAGYVQGLRWDFQILMTMLCCTLGGTIGCSILQRHHVDLGDIDVLHATRAGALGGAVLGVVGVVILPIVVIGLTVILTPLWLAMIFGVEWAYARSTETWTNKADYASHCFCIGTCGKDPEIAEELAQVKAKQSAR